MATWLWIGLACAGLVLALVFVAVFKGFAAVKVLKELYYF